jgi:hypothetical protein
MVDVCGGPMLTIEELHREIDHYIQKYPEMLVVKLKKKKEGGYQFTLYITKEDFNKKC